MLSIRSLRAPPGNGYSIPRNPMLPPSATTLAGCRRQRLLIAFFHGSNQIQHRSITVIYSVVPAAGLRGSGAALLVAEQLLPPAGALEQALTANSGSRVPPAPVATGRLAGPIGVRDVTYWKTRILASTCHFRDSPATHTRPNTGKRLANLHGPV